jgi:hypothetical protein
VPNRSRAFFILLAALLLTGCRGQESPPTRPLLTGRAVLPADTFSPGPAVGRRLDSPVNGRTTPFDRVPVQGFSSLLPDTSGRWLALQDNGFGAMANSGDYPLRWYRLQLDLDGNKPHGGPVKVLEQVTLSDPDSKVPFPLARTAAGRPLCGADFDPESFVQLPDSTFWVGEEFGPSLLHFDARGRLLSAPVPVPVAPPLRPHGRGSYFLRTPDHPDLRTGQTSKPAEELANLPRSGGCEGLARNSDGSLLYVAVEKAMVGDPDPRRRSLLEFDPAKERFTSRFWFYRVDEPAVSVASFEAFNNRVFLVTERDGQEGAGARIKRIYRVDLDEVDADGYLKKQLVCDLLDLRDNLGFSAAEDGAEGLGPDYSFPYVTPESLIILGASTLLVCNDNNYPFSTGRRPGHPDDTEFIRIQLPEPIKP